MGHAPQFGRDRLVSVAGTLLGYGLLALGVTMAGVAAFEHLLASGRLLSTPVQTVPQGVAGVVLGTAGYFLLGRIYDQDTAPREQEGEPSSARAADAYQFDT